MTLRIFREYLGKIQVLGTLSDDGSFAYDNRYLAESDAQAVSFSLPLRPEPYEEAQALPYFKGLLPEGRSLSNLAARLGRSEEDYLGILHECGLDCVGDVIIRPEIYREERRYRKTSAQELGSAFFSNAGSTAADALSTARLSLAGTQDKIGLYVAKGPGGLADDTLWYLPEGGAPSNCILKVAEKDLLPDLMVVEQLSMASARSCGLNAADTELVPIGRGAIVVRRFDRMEASGETIDGRAAPARRHQEDFAQALGLTPSSKYAELPGGTAKTVARFLRAYSAAPALDVRNLLEITLFNFVIGNADNHLKNLSVLYSPNWKTIRLAPAYDLVSTTYYARFSRKMGMALGSTRDIDAVTADDIRELAVQIGVSGRLLRKTARALDERIVPALRAEAERLDKRGFPDAPFISDDLEEDMAPRLKVLGAI